MFDPIASSDQALPLPFHLPTILFDLLRRWYLILLLLLLSAAAGIGAALTFASRTYQSELILQYNPLATCIDDFCEDSPPTLSTFLNRVKTPASLARIRDQLQWEVDLRELGAAITVFSDGGSDLLIIRGNADTPQKALQLVEAIETTFLHQRHRELIAARSREIQRQLTHTTQRRLSIDAQLEAMHQQIDTYQKMANREREDLTNNNPTVAILQRELLLDNLQQDRDLRLAHLELERAQRAYSRAQRLAETNAISQLQLEDAHQALEQAQIAAEDFRTQPDTQTQLERLERAALSGRNTLTPSDHLLLAVLHRSIAVELEAVSLAEEEALLLLAMNAVHASDPEPIFTLENTGFDPISPALLQPRPTSSNRRMIAVFVTALIALLGLGALLLRLTLRPTIRSSAEFHYLFDLPLLATLPQKPSNPGALFAVLTHRLSRHLLQANATTLLLANVDDQVPFSITADDLLPHTASTLAPPCILSLSTSSDLLDFHPADSAPLFLLGPPILPNPTLDLIAPSIDTVVLHISSLTTTRRQLRGALARLQQAHLKCLGVILSDVHPSFLLPEDQLTPF